MRPGVGGGDAVPLPLEKGRAGADAPTFAAELVYLQRTNAWTDKGRGRVDPPALDLPVSRTGLERATHRASASTRSRARFASRTIPASLEAFRQPGMSIAVTPGNAKDASGLQALVDRYRSGAGGGTIVGALPVHVTFPRVGPSIFLACELTEEGRAPSVELTFKRARS